MAPLPRFIPTSPPDYTQHASLPVQCSSLGGHRGKEGGISRLTFPSQLCEPLTTALILLTYLVIPEQATYNTYISPSSTLARSLSLCLSLSHTHTHTHICLTHLSEGFSPARLFSGRLWLWLLQKFRDKGLILLCQILYLTSLWILGNASLWLLQSLCLFFKSKSLGISGLFSHGRRAATFTSTYIRMTSSVDACGASKSVLHWKYKELLTGVITGRVLWSTRTFTLNKHHRMIQHVLFRWDSTVHGLCEALGIPLLVLILSHPPSPSPRRWMERRQQHSSIQSPCFSPHRAPLKASCLTLQPRR